MEICQWCITQDLESTRKTERINAQRTYRDSVNKDCQVFSSTSSRKFHFTARHTLLMETSLGMAPPLVHRGNNWRQKDKDKLTDGFTSWYRQRFVKWDRENANLKRKNTRWFCIKINSRSANDTVRRTKNWIRLGAVTIWNITVLNKHLDEASGKATICMILAKVHSSLCLKFLCYYCVSSSQIDGGKVKQ